MLGASLKDTNVGLWISPQMFEVDNRTSLPKRRGLHKFSSLKSNVRADK